MPIPEELRSQADAYLTALIIFVAPVVALPEFLARYRLHGANLFQVKAGAGTRDQIEHRVAMRGVLVTEIQRWLQGNGDNLNSPDLQTYLKQWTKAQEVDGFELHKPGRWKYFQHLLEYPRIYGEIMSERHQIYSYVRAFAALVLGYDHLYLLDRFRKTYKRQFGRLAEEARTKA